MSLSHDFDHLFLSKSCAKMIDKMCVENLKLGQGNYYLDILFERNKDLFLVSAMSKWKMLDENITDYDLFNRCRSLCYNRLVR
jgi:hypothetical protein